jgi:hypothetical protein
MTKRSGTAKGPIPKEELLQLIRDHSDADREWLMHQLIEGVVPFSVLKKVPRALITTAVFFYGVGRASELKGKPKPRPEKLRERAEIYRRKKTQSLGQIADDLGTDTDNVKKDLRRAAQNIADGWLTWKGDELVLGDPVKQLDSLLEKMQRLIDSFFGPT